MSNLSNQQRIDLIKHDKSDQLNGEDWCLLLRKRPQYADRCDWDKLDGCDWCFLLCDQPQFGEHCQWDKLTKHYWKWLASYQPQFENHPMYKLNVL